MTKLRNRGRLWAAAIAVVAALLIAACSNNDNKATTKGSTASTAATPKGTPITIGVIGSFTGPQAPSARQGQTVAPAWEKYVNQELGGINDHPVKIVLADDGGESAKAQAAEKELVDQEQVLAIIVSSDNLLPAYSSDAIAKKVALVSGSTNSTDWYSKVGVFPTPTDVLSGLAGQMKVAKEFGKATKFANLYCSEVAACGQSDPVLKGLAGKAGIQYTSVAVSSTAPSYTAECLQLKNQKVDYAELNFSAEAAAKFVQDCQQQGFNPTWGSSEQAIGKAFKELKDFTMFGPAYAFPSVADHPGAKKFRDVMKKYAKDDDWAEGSGSFAWDGLEVLRKALSTISTGDPTRDSVLAAMNSVKDENLDGLLPNKVSFNGQPVGFGKTPCYFVVGMKGGNVIAPKGLTPECPTAGG